MRGCLKGRGSIVVVKESIFCHSEIKFLTLLSNGISRMEFEKLKFVILRMSKFGISEMKFK
jgi:hypothetical protein